MPPIIDNIVYQHAENACSLWWQWFMARHDPIYDFIDLQQLEGRINANLDGLLIAGDAALPLLQELLDANDEGSVFAMSIQALRKGDHTLIDDLLETFKAQEQAMHEFEAALAWVHERHLQGMVARLLDSQDANRQLLGLSACLAHQRNPGNYFRQCLTHEDSRIRTRALHFAAEQGDERLLQYLSSTPPEDTRERHAWARALLFLGKQAEARQQLEQLALGNSEVASDAMRLSVLSVDAARARHLLRQLEPREERQRDVVSGFGLLGDPRAMDWLIDRCQNAELARLAGESIALITGVDLAENDLERDDPPEDAGSALNDDPADEHVELEADENLVWPDAERIAAWWHSSANRLAPGTACLCGYPRSAESLRHVLRHGQQRQRAVAAELLITREPGKRYCNPVLPTHRQGYFMSGGND